MSARILLVDDDAEMLRLLGYMLRGQGHEVEEASSGAAALQMAQADPPDLVMLDVMMPALDGYEVCRQLRAHPRTADLPIIMVTAKAHTASRTEGLLSGADDYVTKPIDPVDLAARVEALLTRKPPVRSPTDLLTEIAHGALMALSVDLVWLLVTDEAARTLRPAAIASLTGDEMARAFLRGVKGGPGEVAFPLAPNISPLVDVYLGQAAIVDQPLAAIARLTGGEVLARGLEAVGARAATVYPVGLRGQRSGVLFMVRRGETRPGAREPALIGMVANQAAMAIGNLRLMRQLERQEAEARRAQVFHQTLVNTMGDGLMILDEHAVIKFVNRRLCRMLGYQEDVLLGHDLMSLVHPEDQEATRDMLARTGGTASFEKRLVRSDGSILPVLAVLVSRQPDQTDLGDVIVVTDLSEQKAREAAMERRNRQLAAINHAGRVMASSLDLDSIPSTILEECVQLLGARGGSILLVDEDTGELVFRATVGPESEKLLGMRVPVGEGVVGWIAKHAQPARVPDVRKDPRFFRGADQTTGLVTTSVMGVPLAIKRHVIGVLEVVNKQVGQFDADDLAVMETLAQSAAVAIENARLYRDLRLHAVELEQAYAELKAADRLKDELVQNVSHELRTPLTFILGYVELLLGDELGPLTREQRQGLDIVRRKGQNLTKIVNDIVTLQRTDVTTLQKRPVRIGELVQAAIRATSLAANQAGLQIETEIPPSLPSIPADEERISQVLDNLLGNSLKFSPDGGRITVRVKDAGPMLRVEVQDTGVGIPADKLGKVFERFYQVDGSSTRRFGGVGLGLAICREIVEAHGGEIWVESDGQVGHGSLFIFTLPKDGGMGEVIGRRRG